MFKVLFRHNMFFVFAAFFAIPVIVLIFALSGYSSFDNVVANGIRVRAEVIENSASSSTTINGVAYYDIAFEFKDENGETHRGRTSDAYTYSEILDLEEAGYLYIKYDPETFEAVQADYNPYSDSTKIMLLVFLAVFGIADMVFWIIVVKRILKNVRLDKVEKSGKEYTAQVTGYSSNTTVNGVAKYKVFYSWVGDEGEEKYGVTDSEYNYDVAAAYHRNKYITIKAIGLDSIIVSKPDMCTDYHYDNLNEKLENHKAVSPEKEYCNYCGHEVKPNDEYCTNCGAKQHIFD